MNYKIADDNIEYGDIVAYQTPKSIKKGKRRITVKYYVIGTWDEYWDEDFKRFRGRFIGVGKSTLVVYKIEWLKKIELIKNDR